MSIAKNSVKFSSVYVYEFGGQMRKPVDLLVLSRRLAKNKIE